MEQKVKTALLVNSMVVTGKKSLGIQNNKQKNAKGTNRDV